MTSEKVELRIQEQFVSKGEETNKLHLLRDLMNVLEDLFEEVEREKEDDDAIAWFGSNTKIVSKRNFKVTLTVKIDES